MATAKLPQRSRKTRHPKAFGYLLNPAEIYRKAVENGTAIPDQPFATVMIYIEKIAAHCGVGSNDIIRVYPNRNGATPVYCIVAASNLSDKSKVPRTDIVEKAKVFLETKEEPQWYHVSYD